MGWMISRTMSKEWLKNWMPQIPTPTPTQILVAILLVLAETWVSVVVVLPAGNERASGPVHLFLHSCRLFSPLPLQGSARTKARTRTAGFGPCLACWLTREDEDELPVVPVEWGLLVEVLWVGEGHHDSGLPQ